MKKLYLMAAAVVFAVGSYGAQITWGGMAFDPSSDVSSPSGIVNLEEGTLAFLVFSDVAFSGVGASFDGTSLIVGNATVAKTVDTHTITVSDIKNYGFSENYTTSLASEINNNYYAVLIANKATDPTAYSFYDLGKITDASDQTGSVLHKVALPSQLAEGGWTVSAAGGTGGGTIPEPTSGLLMLIGMAGLALRRKRA